MTTDDELLAIKVVLGQHEVRFDNGRQVMSDIRARIDKLEPQTPDWLKLAMAVIGMVVMLLGAQLWINERLAERLKTQDFDVRVRPIEDAQDQTDALVRQLENNQRDITAAIRTISEQYKSQSSKLDKLLTPDRRR